MDKLLQDVLKKISPSKKEQRETREFIQGVMVSVNRVIEPYGLGKVLAGSYTRDTWMTDKKEFDIFVMFPENVPREELETKGLEVGRKVTEALKGKSRVAYAEHPYTRARIGGYDIDIVPCYNVKSAENIKSAVDRTPFHNRWLSRNFDQKRLSGEVRLLKQFLKALGIYGSDTRTLGFSGYLCELLIIHYKSFKAVVLNASKWNPGTAINLAGKAVDMKKFRGQPLVVIDPVDPGRNVAAAFSPENFMRFVYHCRKFAAKPSRGFFFARKPKPDARKLAAMVRKRGTEFLCISFSRPDVIDDILWPQLRKTSRRIRDILEEQEFRVMGIGVEANSKCYMLLEMEVSKLPEIRKITGPEIFSRKRSAQFLEKYRKSGRIWVEDVLWVAEVKRRFLEAGDKIRHSLSAPENRLREKGIGSHIAKSISGKYALLDTRGVISLAARDREFAAFLGEYLNRRII